MLLKIFLITIVIIALLFVYFGILPRLKFKYKLRKHLKEKQKRQEEFRKKMKELEIL